MLCTGPFALKAGSFPFFQPCCPITGVGPQLLPTQGEPRFLNQQITSQGDGWSENTPPRAELRLRNKCNKNPLL